MYWISRHESSHRYNQTGRLGATPSLARQIVPADLDALRSHSIPRRAIRIAWQLKAETRRQLLLFASDKPRTQLSLAALDVGVSLWVRSKSQASSLVDLSPHWSHYWPGIWDGRARQRTICDGRNDESGTQDDHDPGQRVHSVIGRVFPEQQAQQAGSDNGANVLRSA